MSDDEFRYVRVPETPPDLCDDKGQPFWTFRQCVRWVVNTDERFNLQGPGIRAGARIDAEIDSDSDVWKLRTEDQQLLHAAFEQAKTMKDQKTREPLPALVPIVRNDGVLFPKRFALPYMDAVKNATAAPPDDES